MRFNFKIFIFFLSSLFILNSVNAKGKKAKQKSNKKLKKEKKKKRKKKLNNKKKNKLTKEKRDKSDNVDQLSTSKKSDDIKKKENPNSTSSEESKNKLTEEKKDNSNNVDQLSTSKKSDNIKKKENPNSTSSEESKNKLTEEKKDLVSVQPKIEKSTHFAYIGLGQRKPTKKNPNKYNIDIYRFNPGRNEWKRIALFAGGKRSDAISFVINNTAFVGAGKDEGNIIEKMPSRHHNDIYKFSVSNNSWEKISSFPERLRENLTAFTIDNIGYVGFGKIGAKHFKDIYKYLIKEDKWEKAIEYNSKENPKITFVLKNKLYLVSKSLSSYDFKTKKWKELKSLPKDLGTDISFVIRGKAFLGLGTFSHKKQKNEYSNVFYSYDPEKNKWDKIAPFPGNKRQNAIAFSIDGKGYVGLGDYKNEKFFNDIYEYDPEKNTWKEMSTFPQKGRSKATVFILKNNIQIKNPQYTTNIVDMSHSKNN